MEKFTTRYEYVKIITIFLLVTAKGEIPDYIHVCQRSNPELANCIMDSIVALKPYLKQGIPELEVPPLEPLQLNDLKMKIGSGDTKIATNLSDVQILGASEFKLESLKVDVPSNTFEYTVTVPKVYLEGQYEIDTKLLFLNIKGKGPINMNITGYHFDCTMKGHKIKKNDETYMEFAKMNCNINLDKVTVYLANLFNGNALLGNATNGVINDNVDIFFREIKPSLTRTLEERFTSVANKITLRFSYDELFP